MVYSIYRPWAQPRTTNIINNNIYSGCGNRCGGGGMDSTGWWIFGGGMLLSTLSGIFGGGRHQSYTPGWDYASYTRTQNPARDKQTPDSLDLNALKELYGDKWKIVEVDGTFTAVHKETGEQKTADSYSNMLKELGGKSTSTPAQVATSQGDPMTKELAQVLIDANGLENRLSINDEGKLVYKDKDTNEETVLELTEQNFAKVLQAIKGQTVQEDPPAGDPDAEAINAFNNNDAVKAKNATIAKNGDKYVVTIKDADGKVTSTNEYSSIAAAYEALGLTADGKVKQQGGGKGKFSYPALPNGYAWKEAASGKFPKGTKAEYILAELHKDEGLKNITLEDLIKANPKAIKDGVVSGVGKLEIPTKTTQTSQVKTINFDKATKVNTRMVFDLNAQVATITAPDGTTFRYERETKVAMTGDKENLEAQTAFYKEAEAALTKQAKDAGWTNLTITMKDPKTGKFVNPESGKEITPDTSFDKTKPSTVRYLTADAGNGQTTATAYMPDGSFVSATAPGNEAEAVQALQTKLKNEKWTNVTLVGKKVEHKDGTATRSSEITETSVTAPIQRGTWIIKDSGPMDCADIYAANGHMYNITFKGYYGTETIDYYDEISVGRSKQISITSLDADELKTLSLKDTANAKTIRIEEDAGKLFVTINGKRIRLEDFLSDPNASF